MAVIVMCSGGFDPLHLGHLRHLQLAKKLGDYLVVSVNPDEDLIRKKGYVFMPEEQRMEIVANLKCVDEVILTIPDDGTQGKTLEWISPDIFAKGGDRDSDANMPANEVKICGDLGIRLVYGVGEKLSSSSDLVKRVIEFGKVRREIL